MEREKEERRRREELALEFSAEDLALATVPGADFDPTLRHFSKDELRPQPIIRKRKKVGFVIYLFANSLQYNFSIYLLDLSKLIVFFKHFRILWEVN